MTLFSRSISLIAWILPCLLLAQNSKEPVHRIGFYNVENLFDLEDHPNFIDEDFTPLGRQKWTEQRYQKKLARIDTVIAALGYPDIMGLCEVENDKVLHDLVRKNGMMERTYDFVQRDSPDKRGIDVALLYNNTICRLLDTHFIRIDFPIEIVPDEPDYTSREILHARLLFMKRDTLDVFVNHWPSRYGGVEKSQPKRLHVAKYARAAVDKILHIRPDAKIILMGDFNDEPDNISVQEVLGARMPNGPARLGNLYNLMALMDASGQGTYNYRGNWNMLDQIIVSGSLLAEEGMLRISKAEVFLQAWMMFKHDRFGYSPSRTYGGPNYYGGYSDHLPVRAEIWRY